MGNDNRLGTLIFGFITILVGIVLIGSLADNIYSAVTLSDVTNETITIESTTGKTTNDDVTGVTYFGNGSINTVLNSTAVRVDTEVNWTRNGTITVYGTFTDDDYDISYAYEGDEYVTDSTSRVLMPLVTLFFAIAVMLVGAALVLKGFKGMGF